MKSHQPHPTDARQAYGSQTNDALPSTESGPRNRGAAERVHLLLCTNALFLQHAAVCVASVLANNPDLFFDTVIVSQQHERLDEEKFRRSMASFPNHSLEFRKFSIPDSLVLPLNPLSHYTLDTYSRLWVGEFFPADVTRVLYLDADMVVVGSLAPLWTEDLAGALIGAVDIPGSPRGVERLGLQAEDGYFNAGMLVIDLAQWRATRAEQVVLDYIRENPERVLYDQDALNACFYNRTKRLDYRWNVIRPFFHEPPTLPLRRQELETICREARIIHFNGGSKPWSYFCDHPRRAEYQTYLRMTEWRDFVPPDRTLLNRFRKLVSTVVTRPAKSMLRPVFARPAHYKRPAGVA